MIELHNIIDTWIKDHPDFKEHYFITSHTAGGLTLTWIQCKCRPPGALPPTPRFDMIILDDKLSVWSMGMNDETREFMLYARDPNFFSSLEQTLKDSH